FELNVMMPVAAYAFLESVTILANVCDAFRTKCVDGIEADRERCRELLELNPSIATALNAAIGYDRASPVAKNAASGRRSGPDDTRELGILSEAETDRILDVRDMTDPAFPADPKRFGSS